ncbi:MAG: outer membrane beta-barrel family protein [Flavobacterium sp.]
MKKLLLALCFPILSFSQQYKITGKVINDKNETISQTKIAVFDQKNTLLKTITTDENGNFSLEGISEIKVKLMINDLEYQQLEQEIDLSVPNQVLKIILQKDISQLEEVVIMKQKPLIKRKIDRLEFNVENSSISSLNGWEILKKTPGVVFSNDDFKIKGSSAILVTINDKKVMLTGDELKNLLENTQGNDIKSVEVITNPPAKYEASGSAVLNIVMKKNNLEGYRGTAFTKYIQSQYAKGLTGISQYYKKGKISLMGSYYRSFGNYYREGTDYVNYVEDKTTWISKLNRKDSNKTQNTVNFNLDYAIDSLTNASLNYSGFFNPKGFGTYDVPTQIFNAQNIEESRYRTINDHHSRRINNSLSFQLDRKLNAKSSLSWVNYFASNNQKKYQNVVTYLDFINEDPKTNNFLSNNKSNVQLYSTQLDYNWKNEKWEAEAGSKYSYVSTNSILDFSDNENGILEQRSDKSNVFDYKEYNFSLYSSLTYNLAKWSFKGGLRVEKTDLEGVVSEPFEQNKNHYWKLFPTAYIQYSTENKHQFSLSYGKRIDRPSYSWLNPAKSYYNLFSYFQGDPKLKATIIHNIDFSYIFKEWNVDLYYRKEINPSMEISYQDPATSSLIYHYTNIEKAQAYGLSLYKNFQLKPWWTASLSESLEHNENYFIGVDNVLRKNKVWNFDSTISTSFTLNKANDWKLEIGNKFNTPSIQGTFDISGSSNTYVIMNRKFLNKNFEVSLYLNDIFKTTGEKVSTNYANQNNYFLDYRDTQSFTVNLKYNFGNQSVKNTKAIKKTDEQGRM